MEKEEEEDEDEEVEDHFEYIVEAVRIVRLEGTRQLNVRCSRH